MGTDLAVDKLETPLRICDLLAKTRCELRQEVAVFAGRGFGVEVQLRDLARKERVPLGIESRDVAFGVLYLTRDAEKLCGSAFARDRGVDLAMIVKQTLQALGVAAAVGLIGACHQQGEVFLLCVIASEVGVNALSDIAEESFEAGRWIELFGLVRLAECGIMSLLRALTRLPGSRRAESES
jgi:hypothetical protein